MAIWHARRNTRSSRRAFTILKKTQAFENHHARRIRCQPVNEWRVNSA
jgi:hypothetical protein